MAGLLLAGEPAYAAELVVYVDHIDSNRGAIRIAMDRTESDFRGDGKAFRRARMAARVPEVSVIFRDVPTGRYAFKVYQDENGDGRLNRNLFGVPMEPYGFSNNAHARFSMPSFNAALVEVKQPGIEIRIHLGNVDRP